jgi:hypothetical protein
VECPLCNDPHFIVVAWSYEWRIDGREPFVFDSHRRPPCVLHPFAYEPSPEVAASYRLLGFRRLYQIPEVRDLLVRHELAPLSALPQYTAGMTRQLSAIFKFRSGRIEYQHHEEGFF